MLSVHPAEQFIKYLITLDPQASDESIYALLNLYDIKSVELDYINKVHISMGTIPPVEKLKDPNVEVLKWLRKHQIGQIWLDETVRNGIIEILENKRVKSFIERMTLAGYKPFEISRFLTEVTADAIRSYIHYVFNLDKLLPSELNDFLARHSPISSGLWANRGTDAKQFVLHHEGIAPVEATVEMVGDRLVRLLNDRLFRISYSPPSLADAKMLQRYASALSKAASVLGEGMDAASEFKKLVDKLVLRPEDDGIKTFDVILEGKEIHSGNLITEGNERAGEPRKTSTSHASKSADSGTESGL